MHDLALIILKHDVYKTLVDLGNLYQCIILMCVKKTNQSSRRLCLNHRGGLIIGSHARYE